MLISLGNTRNRMGFVKFWINVVWRLEANNGEGTNKKLALYFCVNDIIYVHKCI